MQRGTFVLQTVSLARRKVRKAEKVGTERTVNVGIAIGSKPPLMVIAD